MYDQQFYFDIKRSGLFAIKTKADVFGSKHVTGEAEKPMFAYSELYKQFERRPVPRAETVMKTKSP